MLYFSLLFPPILHTCPSSLPLLVETEVLPEMCPDDNDDHSGDDNDDYNDNKDDDEPCGTLCVGLIMGIGALILGALQGIIFTFVVFKWCCKSKKKIFCGLCLKDKY